MYDLTGSRRRGTLDGNHRLQGGFDRGIWDGEKVLNSKSSLRSSREWMGYPNWARSTITGRLSRVYHTHGDRGRANTLRRRIVRQTLSLVRMGLWKLVRGVSW